MLSWIILGGFHELRVAFCIVGEPYQKGSHHETGEELGHIQRSHVGLVMGT